LRPGLQVLALVVLAFLIRIAPPSRGAPS